MASMHQLALRHSPLRTLNTSRWLQRRWARVHDVRFVTQHANNRVDDRYRHLLEQKAREKGLKDVGQLKEAYKDKIQDLRKRATVGAASTQSQPQQQASGSPWPTPPPPPQPQDQHAPSSASTKVPKTPGLKTLSNFLDIEKTMDLPQKEIEAIWRLRHAQNTSSLCAAIPTNVFNSIYTTARRHPQFILPGLPSKEAGTDTEAATPLHFLQWTFPGPDTVSVLFTHLAEYKIRGEYAQPHTTLTHHMELAQPKGLVLSQGSVIPDRGVSIEEGKWLVLCMQKFYNTQTISEIEQAKDTETGKDRMKARRKLIEQFNSGDTSFKIEELLDQAERMG